MNRYWLLSNTFSALTDYKVFLFQPVNGYRGGQKHLEIRCIVLLWVESYKYQLDPGSWWCCWVFKILTDFCHFVINCWGSSTIFCSSYVWCSSDVWCMHLRLCILGGLILQSFSISGNSLYFETFFIWFFNVRAPAFIWLLFARHKIFIF